MGSIIAAIDFSSITEALIDTVIEEAKAFQDDIYFIHVAEPDPDFVGFDVGPDVVRDQIAMQYHREHSLLQELSARVKSAGCNTTALLLQGAIVDLLVKQVKTLEARMLIVGSHGHGRVHDLLLGSTTSGLIRHAKIPILIVPVNKCT